MGTVSLATAEKQHTDGCKISLFCEVENAGPGLISETVFWIYDLLQKGRQEHWKSVMSNITMTQNVGFVNKEVLFSFFTFKT